MRPIALLSDFGLQDHFVGEVRATILRLQPQARFFDLSHGVPKGNIMSAAWMLASAWPHLPSDCIVCAMVDPGLGNPGRLILAEKAGKTILSPDNGVISLVRRLYSPSIQVLDTPRTPFLGRDTIAPLACKLAEGIHPSPGSTDGMPIRELPPLSQEPILHVDGFGNVVLDLHVSEWKTERAEPVKNWLHSKKIGDIPNPDTPFDFAQLPEKTLGLYWGSSGFLEIALSRGSASLQLGIESSSLWR